MAPATLPEELRYYVVRDGDAIIPMVPVDQLPPWLELDGIPRQLTSRQKADEGWKSTCNTNHPAVSLQTKNIFPSNDRRQLSPIEVRLPSTPEASSQYLAPDHFVLSQAGIEPEPSRQAGPYNDRSTTVERCSEQPRTPRTVTPDYTTSSFETPVSTNVHRPPSFGYCSPNPSGLMPDHSKKVYCTHWIRTGSCDFTQQGCRYKHEMPSKTKLLELGYIRTPRWWLEKPAIRNPTWMEERRAATKMPENESPSPRAHDRLSWIDRLAPKHDAQSKDDQIFPTPELRPCISEPGKLVTSTTALPQLQDPTCAPRCAFVDDLIDLHDDTDGSTGLDAAMGASSGDSKASLSIRSSFSQPAPTPKSITNDAIDAKLSPGDALLDNEEHLDTEPMVSRKAGHGHDKDTDPKDSSCNNTGTTFRPTRPYYKPQKHSGLAASQHATARVETPQSIEARDKPAVSSAVQSAGEVAQARFKRRGAVPRQVRAWKKELSKNAIHSVTK